MPSVAILAVLVRATLNLREVVTVGSERLSGRH